jgi:hypothetical protein
MFKRHNLPQIFRFYGKNVCTGGAHNITDVVAWAIGPVRVSGHVLQAAPSLMFDCKYRSNCTQMHTMKTFIRLMPAIRKHSKKVGPPAMRSRPISMSSEVAWYQCVCSIEYTFDMHVADACIDFCMIHLMSSSLHLKWVRLLSEQLAAKVVTTYLLCSVASCPHMAQILD